MATRAPSELIIQKYSAQYNVMSGVRTSLKSLDSPSAAEEGEADEKSQEENPARNCDGNCAGLSQTCFCSGYHHMSYIISFVRNMRNNCAGLFQTCSYSYFSQINFIRMHQDSKIHVAECL